MPPEPKAEPGRERRKDKKPCHMMAGTDFFDSKGVDTSIDKQTLLEGRDHDTAKNPRHLGSRTYRPRRRPAVTREGISRTRLRAAQGRESDGIVTSRS